MNEQQEPQHSDGQKSGTVSPAHHKTGEGDGVAISLPKTERAEGPFEHSGETAGWTKQEEEEKEEQAD